MTTRSPTATSDTTSAATQQRRAAPLASPHGDSRPDPTGRSQDTGEVPIAAPHGVGAMHPTVQSPSTPAVQRGLSAQLSTMELQSAARLRALMMLNRFRVMRTIDVAVHCYPERPFKAALTAAQRCVRGLVKEQLIKRYKSDRFQTIYGLTARGAEWLKDHGHETAAASVRRVSDMTNPEHRLWLQFLVLTAEARGATAETEQELLQRLNRGKRPGQVTVQGLLNVNLNVGGKVLERTLRPDALLREPDGATWAEVDRSKRGAERESALRALGRSVGTKLLSGETLKRVVIFCRNERIRGRALAVMRKLVEFSLERELTQDRPAFKEVCPGTFEVTRLQGFKVLGREAYWKPVVVGHVVVQLLPTWLPKARVTAGVPANSQGWMDDDYLPYRRAGTGPAWPTLSSPFLQPRS
jgi:hypothetical protein